MYAPYLSGDKLVKAQMSRKTPPLFFHQLTLLSCFTLVIAGNTADQYLPQAYKQIQTGSSCPSRSPLVDPRCVKDLSSVIS